MRKIIFTFCVMIGIVLLGAQDTYAIDCDSNASTQKACDLAQVDRGVAWINAIQSGPGIDSDQNIEVTAHDGKITLYLHGAVYNANGYVTAANATCLHIYDHAEDYVACSAAPAGMAGVTLSSDTLFRGNSGPGHWSHDWEGGAITMTVDQTVFTEDGIQNADGTYSQTFWVYRCYDGNKGAKYCYSDEMTVTLRIEEELNFTLEQEVDTNPAYIGEKASLSYRVKQGSGEGQTELPDNVAYKVLYFYTGIDGKNPDGNQTFTGAGYEAREIYRGNHTPSAGELCAGLQINGAAGGAGCAELAGGGVSSTTGQSGSSSGTVNVPDRADYVGAKVCAVVVTNYYTISGNYQGSTQGEGEEIQVWGTSAIACSPIYKKPNFRVVTAPLYAVNGADAASAAKTTTGFTSAGLTFGSWAEYLLATGSGTVNNFASGSSFSAGLGDNSSCNRAPLTVANQNCNDQAGAGGVESDHVRVLTKIDNYLGHLEELRTSGDTGTGVVALGGNEFYYNQARGVCYFGSGDINITENIGNPPQCSTVIIRSSGDIHIASTVTEVRAWLIADGSVYTCDNYASDITSLTSGSGPCSAALTVRGPVYANQVFATRTFGADGEGGVAGDARSSDAASAETFDYAASTYVWAYEESVSSDVRLYESGTRELSPRI